MQISEKMDLKQDKTLNGLVCIIIPDYRGNLPKC